MQDCGRDGPITGRSSCCENSGSLSFLLRILETYISICMSISMSPITKYCNSFCETRLLLYNSGLFACIADISVPASPERAQLTTNCYIQSRILSGSIGFTEADSTMHKFEHWRRKAKLFTSFQYRCQKPASSRIKFDTCCTGQSTDPILYLFYRQVFHTH